MNVRIDPHPGTNLERPIELEWPRDSTDGMPLLVMERDWLAAHAGDTKRIVDNGHSMVSLETQDLVARISQCKAKLEPELLRDMPVDALQRLAEGLDDLVWDTLFAATPDATWETMAAAVRRDIAEGNTSPMFDEKGNFIAP